MTTLSRSHKTTTKQAGVELSPLFIETEDIEKKLDKTIFIADSKLNDKLKVKLTSLTLINEFQKDKFQNRDLQYMTDNEVDYIWIDINDVYAREWINKNMYKNNDYAIVTVYKKSSKNAKWMNDLDSDISVKYKVLENIDALTRRELLTQLACLANKILHKPVSKILSWACGVGVTKNSTEKKSS